MSNSIKNFAKFRLNEDVNANLINAKKAVNDQLQAIRNEIENEKIQKNVPERVASIKKQAALYTAFAPLLVALATAMDAKEKSGDKTNIY
jgi:hypothetical protein